MRTVSQKLGGCIIFKKGLIDLISDSKITVAVCHEGGKKRCGGQGDLLAGTLATFSNYNFNYEKFV